MRDESMFIPRSRKMELSLPLPVSRNHMPYLRARIPFTPSEWARLIEVLNAMRPSLVMPDVFSAIGKSYV